MEFRKMGNSDMKVSVISQGSWAIGGPWAHGWGEVDDKESILTIRKSIDAGINFIEFGECVRCRARRGDHRRGDPGTP